MKPLKYKKIEFNNKKKQLHFWYIGGKEALCHYALLNIKKNIDYVEIDKEVGNHSATIILEDKKEIHIPYDIPLIKMGDPEALLQEHISEMIVSIKVAIRDKKVSKAYLTKQLNTSASQLDRLLDAGYINKNMPQLYQLMHLLGLKPKFEVIAA